MNPPDHYRRRAKECRRYAAGLLLLALAAGIAAACIAWSSGSGLPLLACLTCALVSAAGAANELAEARRLDRRSDEESRWQPFERFSR